jgi:hypothetical protein
VTQGTKQKDRTSASASDEGKEGPRTKIVTRTIAWFNVEDFSVALSVTDR